MKFILLAATALIATPVIAQDTMGTQSPPATTQTTPPTTTDPATTTSSDPSMMQQSPAGDPAMQQTPGQQPMPMQGTSSTQSAPMTTGSGMSTGGYQPSQPALQGGQMQPGATVRFQQAQSPSEAFPAPAPLESYPVCRRGQYDKCRQRGG